MVDVDVAPWLACLPLAPVFHPSEEEFADPIAYILKIEKEASQYGICKIVPPFSRAADKLVFSNLNDSLAATQDSLTAASAHGASVPLVARSMCGSSAGESDARIVASLNSPAKFTTRRQQLGWNARRPRGGSQYRAQKLVWESGEYYTLEEFQDKANSFYSSLFGTNENLSPLEVETLFWNAEFAKPISIEYANDIPGSAFLDADKHSSQLTDGSSMKLAASAWNVRNIARSYGSLLKFLPDEVPGVTTPMVYLGMLFSWFAWHVEDHELHSLNYLHTGASKTWYAVPSDAACALEEVIRLYGYGSRLKPRAAFTLLGEKTTILSPEVLVTAGVPCCRLVQNPGDYVITFPRAYHLGFSHGFNCGEAANFATPAWLDLAREAAARRFSMHHLPMLSHEQLLYLFTLSLPRIPLQVDMKRSYVEDTVKSAFVNEVKQNNAAMTKLLELGVEGCVYLTDSKGSFRPVESTDGIHPVGAIDCSRALVPVCVESKAYSTDGHEGTGTISRMPTPWGALPCAACGILCFEGMALVQPSPSSRQRKQKSCITPTDIIQTPRSDSTPDKQSKYAGLCQFNSADGSECDMAPQVSSFDMDEPSLQEGSPEKRSVLALLAETYKEESEEEQDICASDPLPAPSNKEEASVPCGKTSNDHLHDVDKQACQPETMSKGCEAAVCSFNSESVTPFSNEQDEAVENEAKELNDPSSDGKTWSFLKGSARPYVLCLEHALEAVTRLQRLGGSTTIVICHPNHDVIQRRAEDLASEMSVSHSWGQLPIREASESEVDIINKAIHLKVDNASGVNWCAKMDIGCGKQKKSATTAELPENGNDASGKADVEKKLNLGRWCGKQWKASQLHPLLGGGKSTAHLLGQVLRRCELQKRLLPMKIISNLAGAANLSGSATMEPPLKRIRKDVWDPQERVLTAAILKKSKRNAVTREGRKKRVKYDGIQARLQQTSTALTLCKQAAFAECNVNEQDEQGGTNKQESSFNRESSSTGGGCQRNSSCQDLDSMEAVTWHEVPVSCYSDWSNERVSPTAICSTSHQDIDLDDLQNVAAKRTVILLKRKRPDGHQAPSPTKKRIQCVDNSTNELKRIEHSTHSQSGNCETGAEYKCAAVNEEDQMVDVESGSSDEYSLRDGSASDSSPPKPLTCFGASKKRSCNKPRVKRRTWESLLSRLAPKDEELAVVNQDSFPVSCVTETGWDELECGTKQETPGESGKRKRGKTVTVDDDLDAANNPFPCDIEGCTMSFNSEQELALHKKNRCTIKGCGKRFFSHKYLVQHRRVHKDDRPLKCPWQGCTMAFKWAWARTEHIRVHTGERPYACPECDKTFRFVSDFSRHKRNTGHAKG